MATRIVWRLFRKPRRDPSLFRLAISMFGAVTLQILLGLTVVRTHQQPLVATLHVVLGAAILAAAVVLTSLVFRVSDPGSRLRSGVAVKVKGVPA